MFRRIEVRFLWEVLEILQKADKTWVSFDTETTGLHLIKDKPFLMTISTETTSMAIDLQMFTPQDIKLVFEAFKPFKFVVGQNVKYDLHMVTNYGVIYDTNNLTDVMILARLALDTDAVQSLRLKGLAKKYLGAEYAEDEKLVKSALTNLNKARNAKIQDFLYKKGINKTKFNEIQKDTLYEPADIGEDFVQFLKDNPEPNYYDVYKDRAYREIMISYAMNDTEITLLLAKKLYATMCARHQEPVFDIENSIILPLFKMERVGLKIDRNYLFERKAYIKNYIRGLRSKLDGLTDGAFKIGQHKKIKDWFNDNYDLELASSDDGALEFVIETTDTNMPKDVANLIRELRTVEKWYSVYIVRMIEKSEYDGRAYTQIHANRAVTGRLSSDFQQFPKYPLYESDGKTELFNPRRMVLVSGDGYNRIAFLDYSQVELRVQAHYTYVISGGDLNMCRAYMPHQCKDADGVEFDTNKHRDQIFTKDWFHLEDGEKWHAVDLHSATTHQAFPDVDMQSPEFKKLRSLGKSTNFAKNYGATKNALMSQFGFEESVAIALDAGYYKAFPKILDYQNLIRSSYYKRGFVKNLYGRRYYLQDKRFIYKLYNYVIQGSCADMLKRKMALIDKLLEGKKTRFQMNIHDELSFEIYDGEEYLIEDIKKIMEDTPEIEIPIVAEVETTTTCWAEKGANNA